MMKKKSAVFAAVLSLMIAFSSGGAAFAAAGSSGSAVNGSQTVRVYDYSKKGSITFTMKDTSDKSVGGGSLTYYEVAKAVNTNGDNAFELTNDFKASNVDLSSIKDEIKSTADISKTLSDYAVKNKLTGTSVNIDKDGKASITGLELGVYLIAQKTAPQGYDSFNSFIVTVPFWDGSKLVSEADASPKVEPVKKSSSAKKTETETKTNTINRTVTRYNTEEEKPKKLMQTGQLWWPVPLLIAGGLVSCGIGAAKNRAAKKK